MVYVLIVDDDEDDRDLFCDAVNMVDSSIKCIMARNGEEALEGLKSRVFHRPDIIFLDLNMPRLNGMQCLNALKQDPYIEAHTDRDLYNFKIERRQKSSHAIRSGRFCYQTYKSQRVVRNDFWRLGQSRYASQ